MDSLNRKKYLYKYLLGIILFFFLIFIYLYSVNDGVFLRAFYPTIIAFLISSIFFLIPLLVLFFNYYFYNKDSIFEIRDNVFYYEEKGKINEFNISELEKVTMNVTSSRESSFPSFFFWHQYFYSHFELKSGESIFITCLLNDDIENIIPSKLLKKQIRIIPLVKTKESLEFKIRNENLKKNQLDKIENFKIKFKEKSVEDLDIIVNSKEQYQLEAVKAAKELIKEKVSR